MRRINKIVLGISSILLLIGIVTLGIYLYNDYRVKHAIIKVELIDDLDIEVYSDIKLKKLIKNINGTIIKDEKIDTSKLGKKKITFEYINEENIKVPYTFYIYVVDTTPPLINYRDTLTLYKGYNGNIMNNFFCGDNYDDEPKCEIKGKYDVNTVGSYPVIFQAQDSEGNISTNNLTINIIEKENINIESNSEPTYTYFNDIINKHKTKDTKIGIDVSKWQEDIDFKKVKDAGVEFAYIRVGYQKEIDGKYLIDEKFKRNIEGFNKENIKVGVYFYAYASNKKEIKDQVKWIVKQIKDYKIDLPIVFDWENWDKYRDFNLSFYHLNELSKTFKEEVEKYKYKAMLYSSKYYLENVWLKQNDPVWLAHYTENTDYKGKYKIWQICDDGKIDGIQGTVDIDIMY